MKRFSRRFLGSALSLSLAAGGFVFAACGQVAFAQERNADIAQIEHDIAEAGRTGVLPQLQKAWQVRFDGAVGPGERISLEVLPAIPLQEGDPESKQRFERLREQVKLAFEQHRQDTGVFTIILRDGTKLLTSQGMVIPLKFVFRRLVVTSAETNFAGYGQAGCSITTQFFATGTREPLRLGENPNVARFAFSREGIAVLQGYQGQHGEFVVFRRQSNEPVQVSLEYTDPELGQVTRFAPVPLQVCVDAAVPPPPPPPPPPPVVDAPPPVDVAPPPVVETPPPPPPNLPRGMTWGVSGSAGLGLVAEPGNGSGVAGVAFGVAGRIGYFFHPNFALLGEPRLTGVIGPSVVGYKASVAALAQLHFLQSWVLSVGPSLGFAGA
ncbi:MAG TPA: hypothetical protein PKI49_02305, partial [Pseudomonadota bacterium]|nr:hypothetical protein [Pseudomonadota bacterium]